MVGPWMNEYLVDVAIQMRERLALRPAFVIAEAQADLGGVIPAWENTQV